MISHTKMPMTTRSMTAAARRFHAWNTQSWPKKPLYDDEEEWEAKMAELCAAEADRVIKQLKEEDEEEEEEILLTCFKCEKKYMGVEGNCCCGKCCSYCKDCQEEEEKEKVEEEEAEEEKRDWWGTHGDGVVHLKYATEEYMDINFEEWGAFEGLIDTREEEEEE